MEPLDDEVLEDLRAYVRQLVRGGFTPAGEIPEAALEYLDGEAEPERLRPHAEYETAAALVELSEEEKTWPAVTDCDRLDAAFADLESAGVLVRQDFTCCQPCGHAEIADEVESAIADGRPVRGYAFFHHQDTEAVVEGHGLHLAFGARGNGEENAVAIAREVAAALRAQGLQVDWDGTYQRRLSVTIDWKKRRG